MAEDSAQVAKLRSALESVDHKRRKVCITVHQISFLFCFDSFFKMFTLYDGLKKYIFFLVLIITSFSFMFDIFPSAMVNPKYIFTYVYVKCIN